VTRQYGKARETWYYHVRKARSASGEAWASEESLQETNDEESSKALCQRRSDAEEIEDGERNNVDRVTSDIGDFAEGGEKKRPKSICRFLSACVKVVTLIEKTHIREHRVRDLARRLFL
jgi:hypothetical protein